MAQTDHNYDPLDGFSYAVHDYPRLRVLDISDVLVPPTWVGATSLQELEVKATLSNNNAWAAFSSLLNRNPSLHRVNAHLRVAEATDDQPPPFSSSVPISLPSLIALELIISSTTRLDGFLQTLNAPKLSQLSVKSSGILPKADFTGLIATCIEKFNSLKEIILDGYDRESYYIVEEDVKVHRLKEVGIVFRFK
ncbi:hypothetical protein FRC01_008607 [Tulasnella sp. 417]|nr:hypothetical protein FRC01_008607 [Tulasnella sp. 417]